MSAILALKRNINFNESEDYRNSVGDVSVILRPILHSTGQGYAMYTELPSMIGDCFV